MKQVLMLLIILVIVGLIAGIALVISGENAVAGVVWSVTLILSCIGRRVEMYRTKKEKQNI